MSSKLTSSKEVAVDASVHLDAIRGLAALTVFLSHGRTFFLRGGLRDALAADPVGATTSTTHAGESPLISHFRFSELMSGRQSVGHLAVIAFFVLSGYFVGGSVLRAMRKGKFSWQVYLFQRLTRLWVVLVPALLLGWALDAGGLHLFHGVQNIYNGPAGSEMAPGLASRITPGIFLGNLFFLQGILTVTFGSNSPLWSLSYEFWFYLCFPLLAAVFVESKQTTARVVSGIAFMALMGFCGWKVAAYFLIWLLGAGAASLPLTMNHSLRKVGFAVTGSLLLAVMYLELRHPRNLFLSDLVLGVVFTLFLWIVLHEQRRSVPRPYRQAAQTLSGMSYTLYLVHVPLLVFICALMMPAWKAWPLSPLSALKVMTICVMVFALAAVMYLCFERNTDRVRIALAKLGLNPLEPSAKVVARNLTALHPREASLSAGDR